MMISRDNEGKGNEFLLSKEHITLTLIVAMIHDVRMHNRMPSKAKLK